MTEATPVNPLLFESIVPLADLQASLEWDLDPDEQRLAEGSLEEASEYVRMLGIAGWHKDNAPLLIKRLIIKVVARFLRNPDGYVQSRAGDETLMWSDQRDNAGGVYFSKAEEKMIAKAIGNTGLWSVPLTANRTSNTRDLRLTLVAGSPTAFLFGATHPGDEDPALDLHPTVGVRTDQIPTRPR